MGVVADQMLPVQPVEVLAAKIAVGAAVTEKVPRRDEDRMVDGHDGFLVAPPAREPMRAAGLRQKARAQGPPGATPVTAQPTGKFLTVSGLRLHHLDGGRAGAPPSCASMATRRAPRG